MRRLFPPPGWSSRAAATTGWSLDGNACVDRQLAAYLLRRDGAAASRVADLPAARPRRCPAEAGGRRPGARPAIGVRFELQRAGAWNNPVGGRVGLTV